MITVAFVTSGLGTGGAEIVLLNILRELDRTRFAPVVISLTGKGPVSDAIALLNVPVHHVDIRQRPLRDFVRLVRLLRRLRPAVVQTWMYHGDLIGSLAARAAGLRAIAWSLHNLRLAVDARSTRWVRNACALISARVPRVILSCSQATAAYHADCGYARGRMQVIPNGFDTARFRPDPEARAALRSSLGIAETSCLVIHLGRLDPVKNHPGFVRAAALAAERHPDVQFLMAGHGVDPDNTHLGDLVRTSKLDGRLRLLGPRSDVPRLLAACDLLVQTSTTEAFPMALGEAMSCGVPCIATDVGDSALLIGNSGRVVPVEDDRAMAQAIEQFVQLPQPTRDALGQAARQRILDNFDIRLITRRYEAIYLDMARKFVCAA